MTDKKPTLAVFLEAADIQRAIPFWPNEMQLAACLSEDGLCRVFVFHEEEGAMMPRRLCRILDATPDQICIVPEVDGHPTFRFRYMDEITVLTILENTEGLLDEAEDYSANYNFAKEEGLDPSTFMGLPVDEPETLTAEEEADENAEAELSKEPDVEVKIETPARPKLVAESVPLLTQRHRAVADESYSFSSVRRSESTLPAKQYA